MLVMGGYRGVSFFSVGSPLTQTHFVDPSGFTRFPLQGGVRGGGGARGCTTGGGGEPVWPGWRVLWRIHSVQYRWKRGAPEGGEPV